MSSSERPKWWPISWISTWRDYLFQAVAGLDPVVEQRPAVEEDQVDILADVVDPALVEGDALIEAEQLVGALQFHLLLHVVAGEVHDLDHHRVDLLAHEGGDAAVFPVRDQLNFRRARRLGFRPAHEGKPKAYAALEKSWGGRYTAAALRECRLGRPGR